VDELRQFILRWKLVLIVITVLVIAGTIHFTSLTRDRLSSVEQLFRDGLSPFQYALMQVNHSISGFVTTVSEYRSMHERNAELEDLVTELQQKVYQLSEYERENVWLREALDFKEDVSHHLLVSEVIGRSPTNWLSAITINKGRNHGVEKGMAVVSGQGIIGTVQNVTNRTSTVVLSTDPQSAVGGLVQATGDFVLVEGDPSYSGMLIAKPLSRDATIAPGDVIVTSGLSQLFPKKLPIGEVIEVIPGQYNLSFTVHIRPFVDFTRLEYVFVVLQEE